MRHRRNGNTEVEIHRAASHRFLIVPMVLVLFFVSRSIGFFFPTLIALVVLFSLLWRNTTNRLSLTADGWSLRGRLGEPLVSGRFEDVVELRRTQTGGELVLRTGRLPLAASGRPLTDRELVVLRRLFRLSGDTSGQRTADDRAQDDGQAATNFVVAVRSEDDLEAGTNAAAARPVDEEAPSTVTADRSESSREASTGVVAAEVDDIPV